MGPRSHERGNLYQDWEIRYTALASMGPRSHERGNMGGIQAVGTQLGELQWGRVLMNAETVRRPGRDYWRSQASMGPRSHERGNRPHRDRDMVPLELQWGRVLMNAETC